MRSFHTKIDGSAATQKQNSGADGADLVPGELRGDNGRFHRAGRRSVQGIHASAPRPGHPGASVRRGGFVEWNALRIVMVVVVFRLH